MSEHDEQMALFQWAEANVLRRPELALLYAVPNGAKLPWLRTKTGARYSPEALRLKAEGLKPGVPDVVLPVARGGYHGLYIELKYGNNKLTAEQAWWIERLKEQECMASEARGWEAAAKMIENYLDEK